MNDPGSTSVVNALLESARRDGPNAAARAKIWAGVAGAAGAASAAGGAAASATKMLATGTMLGGAVTVGLAAALIYVGSMKPATPMQMGVAVAATVESRPMAPPEPPIAFERIAAVATTEVAATPPSPRLEKHVAPSANAPSVEGGLAQEASLVTRARAALVRGDAAAALREIDAVRSLPARQLVPEELAVRAQALRALGRTREANAADATLKTQYPQSELVHSR